MIKIKLKIIFFFIINNFWSALDLGYCFDNVSELEHVSGLVLAAVYLEAACLFRQLSNHLDRSFLYLFYVLADYQQTQTQPVTQV